MFNETAPPRTPFPVIKDCMMISSEQIEEINCSFLVTAAVNLTCSVFGYYPDITLYFRHNSMRLNSIHTDEWNNTDWTRNKEITIAAEASDIPYICVAGDIPGSRDQEQMASIFLHAAPDGSTTRDATTVISTEKSKYQHWMAGKQ